MSPRWGSSSEEVPHRRAVVRLAEVGRRCHEADQADRGRGWLAGGACARWWRTPPLLAPERLAKESGTGPLWDPSLSIHRGASEGWDVGSLATTTVPSPRRD